MSVPVTWTIDAGNLLTNALLTGLGGGLLKLYYLWKRFVVQHEEMYDDLDLHAGVINKHTTILLRHGMAGDTGLPRLERRRKQRARETDLQLGVE